MGDYLKLFETHSEYETYIGGQDVLLPNVSYCEDNNCVHYNPYVHNYADDYLTFIALQNNSSLELKKFDEYNWEEITPTANVEYSTDGFNWSTWDYSAITLNQGETVYIRGNNPSGFSTPNYDDDYTVHFFSTPNGSFECHGNIMCLLYGGDFKYALTIPNASCFANLFYNEGTEIGCNITTAPVLPATTLTDGCYVAMFRGCTSLTTAPELPATTLASYCYSGMFQGCTSLTTAPELLSTGLIIECYKDMFQGCTSLTTAPELPATTLAYNCYGSMFQGCTSLTTAPELSATTLVDYCYSSMFKGCTSLTTAPVLPATTLVGWCYQNMFNGCTSLNYIKAMFTTEPTWTRTQNWVSGVAATGTFVKNSAAQWDVSGVNGVPDGWTVQTASA